MEGAKPLDGIPTIHRLRVRVTADHLIEVTRYSRGYWTGFRSGGGRRTDEEGKDKEKNRRDTARRRKMAVIDAANCNFDVSYAKFLTLTFAENVTDVGIATQELNRFLTVARKKYGRFRYLWVVEFQKRGAVHFHMLMDIPEFIPQSWIERAWGRGFIKINAIEHVDNIGAYISKYMAKVDDRRLDGRRAYGMSRNMARPREFTGKEAELIAGTLKGKAPTYAATYVGEHVGQVTVEQYNLKRGANNGYNRLRA